MKPGDKVRVVSETPETENDLEWLEGMDELLGQELTLRRKTPNGNWLSIETPYILATKWLIPMSTPLKPGDKVTVLDDTEVFTYRAPESQGEAWIQCSEDRSLCVRESWLRLVGTPVVEWHHRTKGRDTLGNVWIRCVGGAINTNPSIPEDFIAVWRDDQLQAENILAVIDNTLELTL